MHPGSWRWLRGAAALIAAPLGSLGAQSLHALTARVDVAADSGASVQMVLRFDSSAARVAKYSLIAPSVDSVDERVSTCDGRVTSSRRVVLDDVLFPALTSALLPGCTLVELSYQAREASRVPLLVPDIFLAPNGLVTLEVRSPVLISGATFPRLSWGSDGVGRKDLRQVPAVITLPITSVRAGASRDLAGRPGFGWTFYGFFVCALLYVGAFFFWARRASTRPELPDAPSSANATER